MKETMLETEMKRLIHNAVDSRKIWRDLYEAANNPIGKARTVEIVREWDIRVKCYQEAYKIFAIYCPESERFLGEPF